jgi:myo-inositol-1(or 4)-monophosphatase
VKPVDFSGFVDELATASGQAILPFFRTAMTPDDKGRGGAFDPVTEADRAAEVAMRRLINQTFPSHGIVGEEFGSEREDAELVWVLDPIDGTRAFVSGLPSWGTLIGLMRGGRAAYGMMHQPFIGERFFGDGGAAGYRGPHGERRLFTRRCPSLDVATLATTSPRLFGTDQMAAYERVESAVRLTRYGFDCYAYCMLAAGHLDVVVEAGLKPYDIVALIPIIQGAGGIVTTWDGEPAEGGGAIVACGDPRLHPAVLERLKG